METAASFSAVVANEHRVRFFVEPSIIVANEPGNISGGFNTMIRALVEDMGSDGDFEDAFETVILDEDGTTYWGTIRNVSNRGILVADEQPFLMEVPFHSIVALTVS